MKTLLLYSIRPLWGTFSHVIWDFLQVSTSRSSFHYRSRIPQNWGLLFLPYIACKFKNSKNSIEWLIKFVIEIEDKKLSYISRLHTFFEMIYCDRFCFWQLSSEHWIFFYTKLYHLVKSKGYFLFFWSKVTAKFIHRLKEKYFSNNQQWNFELENKFISKCTAKTLGWKENTTILKIKCKHCRYWFGKI